jgi:hypothetical protein
MNNTYFFSLICVTVLALAPACCSKKQQNAAPKEDIKTMIELDSAVVETAEDNDSTQNSKF